MCPDDHYFLHGKLTIRVLAARHLEAGKDKKTSFFRSFSRMVTSSFDGLDPYVCVQLTTEDITPKDAFHTPVLSNTQDPEWNYEVELDVAHEIKSVDFRVKADKRDGPLGVLSQVKNMSMLTVLASDIIENGTIEGWFPLAEYTDKSADGDEESFGDGSRGELHIEICYQPIAEVAPALGEVGLENSYYPVRSGVNVTLYQDAEVTPGSLGEVPCNPDYHHARCWVELSKAIMDSTKIIYISGWAVYASLVMVRTADDDHEGVSLGDMLKQKADEGVKVCVLAWDELASNMFSKGLMGTHDEELVDYFEDSAVTVVKVPRQNDAEEIFSKISDSVMYTHHQKSVIVSRLDEDSGKHRLEAWVGGLDVTDGRYDNGDHSLFRTLDGVHAGAGFWQACALEVGAESGPREPWHDIHSKVTGGAAWDILENFTGRWQRQAKKHADELLEMDGEEFVTAEEENDIEDGSFNVQMLRSINECSAKLDMERPGIVMRLRSAVDASIQRGYVHAIRRAKHFIYIENQYFLGSSHLWNEDNGHRGSFSDHIVAIELAEKICAKIRAGERFVAYVVVPLYPEGPPDSAAVSEILCLQRETVTMITSRIAAALRDVDSETEVRDWFVLMCLVNRESTEGGMGNGGETEQEQMLSASRRFMVYVHSKFAIFDDAVAIIGSANINSRSMEGGRDSEIAAMVWQPDHMPSGSTGYGEDVGEDMELPTGDVASFRYSLWREHLGDYFDEMENPASLDCVAKVREMTDANWENFAVDCEEPEDMPHGHLATYPYSYDPVSGEAMPSTEHIPDFPEAPVGGKASFIPNTLTG